MVNYTPGKNSIAFLTAEDLIRSGLEGEPIELEYAVDEVRLTKDAGEMLDKLSPDQREEFRGLWEE